jgi:ribosome maturation protein SDO1
MVSLDEAVTARLESHGKKFEILVDPDIAIRFKEDPEEAHLNLDAILAAEEIFEDANQGDRASDRALEDVFGTSDLETVVDEILREGDLQLTTEQRQEMREEKWNAIVDRIARTAINPQMDAPHPPQRIENAMEEADVQVDPFESVERQLDDIVDKLRPLIPLRFETIQLAVRLPPDLAGSNYGWAREWGDLQREEWQNDGSWVGVIEMPAGRQAEFYDELNERTKGNAETKRVDRD